MEVIDLDEYNLNYELQYIDLMVRVLKPFIRFHCKKDVVSGSKTEIFKTEIFKRGSGILIEEKITVKEFIYFIHYTFPEIVQKELEKVEEEEEDEELKRKVFFACNTYKNSLRPYVPEERYNQRQKDTSEEYFQMLKKMSVEEITEQKENYNISGRNRGLDGNALPTTYDKKMKDISARKNRFNTMTSKLRTIKDVLQFLENLQYSSF